MEIEITAHHSRARVSHRPDCGTIQKLAPGNYQRHPHGRPYAAIVLSGSYDEAGDTGRWVAGEGDVVFHDAFEAHANRLIRPAQVVNISVPFGIKLPPLFSVNDIDALIVQASKAPADAWRLLDPASTRDATIRDWPDLLACDLRAAPVQLGSWAEQYGLAPATVSRAFRTVFGETPVRYRSLARARSAWRRTIDDDEPLAQIALDCGFADQAHLCRSILELTGDSPRQWRYIKKIQDEDDSAA